MSKLYCITYRWNGSSKEVNYVAARRYRRESSYVHGAAYIQYALVHTDKKKLDRKLISLKKEFPDDLKEAEVRPLTEKELKTYLEEKAYHE